MNNEPQQVTLRYVGNLIRRGSTPEFELVHLLRRNATHDEIVIGHYYEAIVNRLTDATNSAQTAAGVTPYQAVQRALSKAGLTFR
jgi:hypothetical protein